MHSSAPAVPRIAGITQRGTVGPRRYGSWYAVAVPVPGVGLRPTPRYRWWCTAGITQRCPAVPWRYCVPLVLPSGVPPGLAGTTVGGTAPPLACRRRGLVQTQLPGVANTVPLVVPGTVVRYRCCGVRPVVIRGRGVWLRGLRGVSRKNPTITCGKMPSEDKSS